ncbi:cytochrome c [Sphingomonas panacisoli]|uniref:Cytochrome c n=1 Tax=Sphingomonas panacisoli TaxID=1813879 RepID=A0A5B8LFA4_9SPHN|nr:cytochrome c [Sphingomonas panacisoli]QDZ06877.1 cytochrome c [Sphingomonas panacisoli]
MIRATLKQLGPGWLLGVATVAVAGAIYFLLVITGITFNTSATQPHSKLFAWGVHVTMTNSVRRRSTGPVPRLARDDATLLSGARLYETRCLSCHGGPGTPRADWARAMLPTPPYLLDAPKRWTHAELYTLVHDGVKMTGMPAWGEVQSDEQVAQVVAFVEAMGVMTPDQFTRWRQRARSPQEPPAVSK